MGGWAGGAGGLAISVKTRNALASPEDGSLITTRALQLFLLPRNLSTEIYHQ